MHALAALDYELVLRANLLVTSHSWLRTLTYVCAELLIFLYPLVLYLMWELPEVGSRRPLRKAVMMSVMASVIAFAIKSAITVIWVRPRPFISHPGLAYFNLGLDPPSFPSGHAMVSFAIATSLLWSGYRKPGVFLLALAAVISAARVFAGVHYPSDVIGGALIGIGVSSYLHREASTLKRYLPNT
jgi:undecaprenyl-diphosphatase